MNVSGASVFLNYINKNISQGRAANCTHYNTKNLNIIRILIYLKTLFFKSKTNIIRKANISKKLLHINIGAKVSQTTSIILLVFKFVYKSAKSPV